MLRLSAWKRNYISLGGRVALIRSTLSNLSTYYLSIFKAPRKMIKTIRKLQRDCLWEPGDFRKDHLLKWRIVYRPAEKGALGLGNLIIRNDALLTKWLWWFPREVGSLWHLVIFAKYGLRSNGWDSIVVGRVLYHVLERTFARLSSVSLLILDMIQVKVKMSHLKLNFDGSAKGNPGPASFGCIIWDGNGQIVLTICGPLGEGDSTKVELLSLLYGLREIRKLRRTGCLVEGDSKVWVS